MAVQVNSTKKLTIPLNFDLEAEYFEDLLSDNSIILHPNSAQYKILHQMKLFTRAFRDGDKISFNEDLNIIASRVIQMSFLIRAIHLASSHGFKSEIESKLNLFKGSSVIDEPSGVRTRGIDKKWELLSGCMVSAISEDSRFDEHPDIRCTFNSVDLGLACKVLYTKQSDKQINRIIEGAKQIEKSSAEYGSVLVYISNLIDRSYYLPKYPRKHGEFTSFKNANTVMQHLRNEASSIVNNINQKNLAERIRYDANLKTERLKTRAVFFIAQIPTIAELNPTLLTSPHMIRVRNILSFEMDFVDKFNEVGLFLQSYSIS